MLLTTNRYTDITGQSAPASFASLESRVVRRLESLLGRILILDENLEEGDAGYGEGFTEETLPNDLAEAIAWGVATLNDPQPLTVPHAVASFGIAGEYNVAVTNGQCFTADGVPLSSRYAFCADLGGRCVTLALRYRRVAL
jgi:hypothetical protein